MLAIVCYHHPTDHLLLTYMFLIYTEYGDLYIWGWNESGQLGFPKQTEKDKSTSRSPLAKKRRWSGKDEASKDEMSGNSSAKEEVNSHCKLIVNDSFPTRFVSDAVKMGSHDRM